MGSLKSVIKKTPVVRSLAQLIMRWKAARHSRNFSSSEYWESRYRTGHGSGAGSYNRLAAFKAEVLNQFVAENKVASVIEFGCGDGSQLKLAAYPTYVGADISHTVLNATRGMFVTDPTKQFIHIDDLGPQHHAELSLSLDVVYHLVEDHVFERHMNQLFDFSTRFVIIYSSDKVGPSDSAHVRHRKFSDWIARNRPDFELTEVIKNPYPYDVRDWDNTSFADFHFFRRCDCAP